MSNAPSAAPTGRLAIIDAGMLLLVSLLLVSIFYDALIQTAETALSNDDYSHGILLPPVVAFILWEKRQQLRRAAASVRRNEALWISILVLGLAIFLVGLSSDLHFPMWIALFPTLLGTIGLIWGSAVARLCVLPLAILYMAKPLPDVLMPKLFGKFQDIAAHTSARALEKLGIPTFISGNIIEIPGMKLLVEEACSGMRSVITLLTVALIILAISRHSVLVRGIIVTLSLGLALALNVVRVTLTGVLAYEVSPELAHGFMHSFSGLVTFLIGFLLLYLTSWWLEKGSSRSSASRRDSKQ